MSDNQVTLADLVGKYARVGRHVWEVSVSPNLFPDLAVLRCVIPIGVGWRHRTLYKRVPLYERVVEAAADDYKRQRLYGAPRR